MTNTRFKEVYTHLEGALNAYHNVTLLSSSPLTELLNINLCTQAKCEHESATNTKTYGNALRNLLDTIIDRTMVMPRYSAITEQTWRLEDYLHLRYRERIPHATIAQALGYSELHMRRLRDELMAEAAELIVENSD